MICTVYEHKANAVFCLEEYLNNFAPGTIRNLSYQRDDHGNEYVYVTFDDKSKKRFDVTGDSALAILYDLTKFLQNMDNLDRYPYLREA